MTDIPPRLSLRGITKRFPGVLANDNVSFNVIPGEIHALLGENGAGKSTFLNIIQQIEKPDSGKVNIGETVTFGYYSQKGLHIGEDMRMIEWVKRIAEFFPLADGAKVSASEFLTRFLFPPEQQYTFISKLSGGEKKRLHLLSILFANPNFLILDEPTNDLDIQTLQILEDFLESFPGCVMIVSHDRYFMDRMVDHLFVFEGQGIVRDFPGNYGIYQQWLKSQEATGSPDPAPASQPASRPEKPRLSYKEKREFDQLAKEIEALNREKEHILKQLQGPGLPYEEMERLSRRFSMVTEDLHIREFRWLELSEMQD